ncbi:MAG: DUF4340 domain-containing protein [Byssovorax sp.]
MKTDQQIYIALAILALGAGGLYLTQKNKAADQSSHSATAASADLPSISVGKDDVEKITKLELASPSKDDKTKLVKVTLEKKGDNWEVTAPVSAKANAANVRSLLDNLKDLKVKESIDKSASSYAQYDLSDDKAVHLVAYKGADKTADLYFGKSGSRGQMARVGGKDGVYTTSGYSSYLYAREVKNWRETSILKFEDANAIQVEVTNKNGAFSFSKNGEKWSGSFTKRDKDGKLDKPEKDWKGFDEGKVKDLLRAYKTLTAEDFGEEKDMADSGLGQAEENGGVIHIKLKDNAGDLTIKVGKTQKGTSHWAQKDGDPVLYVISSWTADWATAAPSKFEKSADDKKGKPPGGAPPGMPGMPPGMGMEEPPEE